MLRVWLDDERKLPAGYDIHVKTAAEAIALVETGQVETISLDNDLGTGMGEGRDVAAHIERLAFEGKIPKIHCHVHTANPVARDAIKASLRNAYRFWMAHDQAQGDQDRLLQD